jgi:uncharacterized protein YbjT (DUF2867 family)
VTGGSSEGDVIVVVGGTGRVGRQLVARLQDAGEPVRVVSRGNRRPLPGAETARADLADPPSLEPHLRDARAMFLAWPFTEPDVAASLAPQIAALAARHGLRVVYLSAQPAGERPESFWALVERAIEESGAEWTFVRPTGFAANTLMWSDQIRAGDVVRWPFGRAARSLIDERDIAAVAAVALTGHGHAGVRYLVSGPAVLTQAEQVAAIGQAIGRRLAWDELPPAAALEALTAAWGDASFAASALRTWEWFVDHPETVTDTVEKVTGRAARSFAEWAAANAGEFS